MARRRKLQEDAEDQEWSSTASSKSAAQTSRQMEIAHLQADELDSSVVAEHKAFARVKCANPGAQNLKPHPQPRSTLDSRSAASTPDKNFVQTDSLKNGNRLARPSDIRKALGIDPTMPKKDWGECVLTFETIREPVSLALCELCTRNTVSAI